MHLHSIPDSTMLGEASAPLRALPCPPSRPPRLHWLDSALQAPSWPPALRSRAAHLPGEEGSETAWTMSVDSASSTLALLRGPQGPHLPGAARCELRTFSTQLRCSEYAPGGGRTSCRGGPLPARLQLEVSRRREGEEKPAKVVVVVQGWVGKEFPDMRQSEREIKFISGFSSHSWSRSMWS